MQAMNFFAGLLLLLMSEENAFWWVEIFKYILHCIMVKLIFENVKCCSPHEMVVSISYEMHGTIYSFKIFLELLD